MDYFNDPAAEIDQEAEEEFVPRPYSGRTARPKTKTRKGTTPKKAEPEKAETPAPKPVESSGQISMLDFMMPEEKAG